MKALLALTFLISIAFVGCGPIKLGKEANPHVDYTADFFNKVGGNYTNKYGSALFVDPKAKTFKITTPITATTKYLKDSNKYSNLLRSGKAVCTIEFEAEILEVSTIQSLYAGDTKRPYLKFKELRSETKFSDQKVQDADEFSETEDGKAKYICKQTAHPFFSFRSDQVAINSYTPASVIFGTSGWIPSDTDNIETTSLEKELNTFSNSGN